MIERGFMTQKFKVDSKTVKKIKKLFRESIGCEIDPDGLYQAKKFYEEKGHLPIFQKLDVTMEQFRSLQKEINKP